VTVNVLAVVCGCTAPGAGADDGPDGPAPPLPGPDALGPGDAQASGACPEVRFESPGLIVRACPEVGRVALAETVDGEPYLFVEVGAEGLEAPLDPETMPGQAWRSGPDGVTVRWTGESGPSPLGGADTDAALSLDVRILGSSVRVQGALRWPAAARFPGPYRPVVRLGGAAASVAPVVAGGQVVWEAPGAAMLATPSASPGPPVRWTLADTTATLTPRAEVGLLPGATWLLPPVELDRGATADEARLRWASRHAPARAPVPRWGWRSGPAYGALISSTVLTEVARALPILADHPPPLIAAEGRWFDRLGADAPSPGFPDGLAAVADAVRSAGAALALRWAPLATDRMAGCGDCPLDPRDPMVRDGAARRAEALVEAGVRALFLALPDEETPAVFVDGLAAIAGARALLGLPATSPGYPVGTAGVWAIAPSPAATTPGTCDASTLQASQDARCREALRALLGHGLSPATAAAPDPDVSRDLALALARAWPVSAAGLLLDPGPVLVGQGEEAAARRRATLSALAGGLYLLGDPPGGLSPARLDLYLAPLRRGLLRWPAARPSPRRSAPGAPPDVWVRSGQAVAVFNDGPRTDRWPAPVTLAAATPDTRWVDVFSGQTVSTDAPIEVPAGDVRVLVAPAADIE
jgi:hypothetical protein